LRVAQVLGGSEDGGLEKHTIELTHALKKQSIDVSVIAHKKFKKDFENINFIELDLSKTRNNPFILYRLQKILNKGEFDIIHTQANKATDMVIKLKPFLNSKIISTLHGYKKNTKSFEKADFVITVSDKIGEKLKTKNKTTIYNGIQTENIKTIDLNKKFNIENDKFIVSSVGRFVKVKNFDILIKSIKDIDVHLVLVGDGEEKDSLEKLARELGLEERVTFCGSLNQIETQEIIKSSDLIAITSQREGFSYVFAEALLLKTPLISTDVADIKKFITEKYIAKDIETISKKIGYIKKNYTLVSKEFKEMHKKVKEDFSINNMTQKTIDVYKKVLKYV